MKERLEYEDNLKDLKKRININEKKTPTLVLTLHHLNVNLQMIEHWSVHEKQRLLLWLHVLLTQQLVHQVVSELHVFC